MMITESFPDREARDARWKELRDKGKWHILKTTTSKQDDVRLASGKMVDGEMDWQVKYPAY